jgi:hypothetical protein
MVDIEATSIPEGEWWIGLPMYLPSSNDVEGVELQEIVKEQTKLTARQQYILELVKEQVRARTCTMDEATKRAIASAALVFGESRISL